MAFIGVDIGGTKIAVGVADAKGNILVQDRFLVEQAGSPEGALDRVAELSRDLVQRAKASLGEVAAIGIGSPGPFHDGKLADPANLPGWDGIDLAESLRMRLERPAYLQNDANAAAIGEWLFGRGRGVRHLAYITVSTGVGCGLVLNGEPYGGPHGNAAEIGHIVIDPEGPRCNCGLTGCLEALASGTAIGRAGRERAADSDFLRPLGDGVDAAAVMRGWSAGDRVASEIVEEAANYLGHGLGILVNLVNPERIALGGGVMNAGAPFLAKVRQYTEKYSMPTLYRETELVLSGLGNDTGLAGAVAVAMVGQRS